MPPRQRQSELPKTVEHLTQLGDPLRLRMLRVLCQQELSVGELVKVMQIPQSSGSRHLKVLSEGNWVIRRNVGTAAYYRVVLDELPPAMRTLWLAVRDQTDTLPEAQGDDTRLISVIAERITDSESFFGQHAGQWDSLRTEMFGERFTDQAMLGLIDPTWRVADLGCGTGNVTELLAPWVDRVIAIDRSPEMLDGARARLEHMGTDLSHVEFRRAELCELPFEDESIDAAVCMLVLHHVPDPLEVLREMRRVLTNTRHGGLALIIDMLAHQRADYRRAMGHEHLGFAPDQIESLMNQAGFEHVRVRPLRPDVNASGPPLFAACARIEP